MVNVNDREQSEFNMAVSYLNRLNALFYACDEASMNLDSHTWFHCLITLFKELSTEMKPTEIEAFNKDIKKINIDITKTSKINTRTGQTNIPPQLYWQLHDLDIKIRRILKEAGLQSKMKDDPRFAMR